MKIKTLPFILVIISLTSQAQESKIGIIGGVNFATIKFSESGFGQSSSQSITPDRAAKTCIGLTLGGNNESFVSFKAEVLFNQMGFKPDQNAADKVVLNYATISTQLQFWLTKVWNIHGGMETSILLGGNDLPDGQNASDGLKQFDLSASAGMEVMPKEFFLVGFRYLPGILNILETSQGGFTSAKNNSMRVYIAFLF